MYQRDDGPMTRANGRPREGTVGTPRPFGNRSGGTPLVASLETANIGELDDLPELGRLYRAMVGRVHIQRLVNPPLVVEVDIVSQNPAQVPLVQDGDVVQAFPAQRPDHPFRVRILPRTPRGSEDFSDIKTAHAPAERRGEEMGQGE